MIYLNNAATSFPKPTTVVEAVSRWLLEPPADPGRESSIVEDPLATCRAELAALFGVEDPNRLALLSSATHAINLVIHALVKPGSHVITTMLEHNSVLRPIAHRQQSQGVTVTHVWPDPTGQISAEAVAAAVTKDTSLIVMTHASNVTGSIQPTAEVAEIAAGAGIPLLVDAAQSAGAIPIVHQHLPGQVYIAFAGHKGLLGLPGTGGLVLADRHLPQLIVGGTGVRSESLLHPPDLPLRHEAGTPNLPGVVGLLAGVRAVRARGVEVEGAHRHHLVERLRVKLERVKGVRLLPLSGNDGRAGIVSFAVDGWAPEEMGYVLRTSFGIITRSGLHCAPLIHQVTGTAPLGTIRASVGPANSPEQVDALAAAVAQLVA
ncbi:MAG: aminotransferase class V-fold PLP-dependent enzyme [Anaerolineae bacterium]|nr:aminotransferase class V-fold PLP-dependent enzyme [Anaerolineae bacterium]